MASISKFKQNNNNNNESSIISIGSSSASSSDLELSHSKHDIQLVDDLDDDSTDDSGDDPDRINEPEVTKAAKKSHVTIRGLNKSISPILDLGPSKKRAFDSDNDDSAGFISLSDPLNVKKAKNENRTAIKKETTQGSDNSTKGGQLALNEDFISFDFSESDKEDEGDEDEDEEETDTKGSKGKLFVHKSFPWILKHDHSTQREIADWLTLEINDFVSYISPSKEEIIERNGCITRLKNAIESFWRDSHVYVFGSYATDLYLPHSDIDIVVKTDDEESRDLKDHRNYLYKLSNYLKNKRLVTNVEVLAKARVPIIKLVEAQSGIHVDISFERSNGLDAAMTIKNWVDTTPGLRELVLVVKHFLSTRNLNDVHIGGLGGYSCICLVYTFLKLHPRLVTNSMDPLKNMGVLLIEFFELFGKNFGYDYVAVAPVCRENNDLPGFINKNHYPDLQSRNQFQLAIQDPNDPTNNISRGSFNIRGLKKAFTGAFDLLVDKCFELESKTYKERINESILGNIVKYKGEARDFVDERPLVKNVALIEHQFFYFRKDHRKSLVSDIRTDTFFLSDDDDEKSESDTSNANSDSSSEEESDSNEESDNEEGHRYLKGLSELSPEVNAPKPEKPKLTVSIDQIMGLSDNEEDQENNAVADAASKNINRNTDHPTASFAAPSNATDISNNSATNTPSNVNGSQQRSAASVFNNIGNITGNNATNNNAGGTEKGEVNPAFKQAKRDYWKQKGSVDLSY